MRRVFEQVRATVKELQIGASKPDLAQHQSDLIQALEELDRNLEAMEPEIRIRDQALVRAGILFGRGFAKDLDPEASVSRPYLEKMIEETDRNLSRG